MRTLATSLLIVMAGIFVLARSLEEGAGFWSYVRAFAEAAMVGGLADWFAVTALFRHPLGLKIPHTAIVRTEQARIGTAVARFVRGSFLSRAEVARQWSEWQPMDKLLIYLSRPEKTRQILKWVISQGPKLFRGKANENVSELFSTTIRRGLSALPVTKLIEIAVQGFLKSPSHREVIAPILSKVATAVEKNREWVSEEAQRSSSYRNELVNRFAKTFTGVVSTKAVDKLVEQLRNASADQAHPIYDKIEQSIEETVADIGNTDPASWREIKETILKDPQTKQVLEEVFKNARKVLTESAERIDQDGTLDDWAVALSEALDRLQGNPSLEKRANELALRAVDRLGPGIETLIARTVASWEADELVNRLETQVGADLQFIRINGTLIGGMVGLVLHGLGHLIWS